MTETSKDAYLIQVLIQRFERIRLPIALDLKSKVDRGDILNEMDIELLESVFHDFEQIKPLIDRHAEWQALAARIANLYNTITTRALENEQR